NHGFVTGQQVVYDSGRTDNSDNTAIGGLADGTTYYAIVEDGTPKKLRLASSKEDALAGKAIDLTSRGSGTNHSIREVGAANPGLNNSNATDPGLVSRRISTPATANIKGVAVTATSTTDVEQMMLGGAGTFGGGAAIAGAVQVTVNHTKAYIDKNAVVNN